MNNFYKLSQPKVKATSLPNILDKAFNIKNIYNLVEKTENPSYIHWEKIKRKSWLPEGISKEEFWSFIKFKRKMKSKQTNIYDEDKKIFSWIKLDRYEEFLHKIDLELGGSYLGKLNLNDKEQQQFISRGIIEEAIASSQLEGAHKTRDSAKKMIQENKKPMSEADFMIMNNYKTMKIINEEFKNEELSLNMIFELHKLLTKDVLEKEKQGCFRSNSDEISVGKELEDVTTYIPPSVNFVKKEMNRLIKFANNDLKSDFIHPVIKAIMIHFWIGMLHPFKDGNGRLARALFYWYLIKEGYWAFQYLTISTKIKLSPIQYGNSYIYSEQDDNDLTYFIDYNLGKIKMAYDEFKIYIENKHKENKNLHTLISNKYNFNSRQIQLLKYLSENKKNNTTVSLHKTRFQISIKTAIKDLKTLEKYELVSPLKQGRYKYYFQTEKIKEIFKT